MYLKANRALAKGHGYICTAEMSGTRRKANAKETRLVGLDYDKLEVGQDMQLVTRLRELGLSAIYWMTHSHRPASPRMRILVEVDFPLEATVYRSVWIQVATALGLEADTSTSHPDQPLFLPGPLALVVRMPGRPFHVKAVVPILEKTLDLKLKPPPDTLSQMDRRVLQTPAVRQVLRDRDSYPSPSDFDYALFSEIARQVNYNPNRAYHIAWHSGAYREKWNRLDYIERTLSSVIGDRSTPPPVGWQELGLSPMDQLIASPPRPTEWILPELWARGAASFLVGRPKGGKSTLALQMALAAAGAREVWTSWATNGFRLSDQKHRVLYMDLEQSDPLFYQAFKSLRLDDTQGLPFSRMSQFPKLDDEGIEFFEKGIDRYGFEVIVIDTWLRVDSSDLLGGRNVFANQGAAIQRVTELAHRKNVHVCLLVHAGKYSDPADPTMQVAGTSAMVASVDDIMALSYLTTAVDADEGSRSRRVLTLMGRHYSGSGNRYVIERQEGRLEMLGDDANFERNVLHQTILEAMADGHERTTSEIADITGLSRPRVSKTLHRFLTEGRIDRAGRRWAIVQGPGGAEQGPPEPD